MGGGECIPTYENAFPVDCSSVLVQRQCVCGQLLRSAELSFEERATPDRKLQLFRVCYWFVLFTIICACT